jgi:hypothetical protein
MKETPQQYTERILSNVGDADPWQILASTTSRLRDVTAGRSEEELSRASKPGGWSVRQIVAHLADCEVVAGWRLRSILASNGTVLQPFDQNRWAEVFRYEDASIPEALGLFDTSRRANIRLLRSVHPALLDNFGTHPERGRESITHLVRLYAGHDRNHLRQIEALLGA